MLAQFVPSFNQRFGVPAGQPEPIYRPVDSELDLGGVLCIKEQRREAARESQIGYSTLKRLLCAHNINV